MQTAEVTGSGGVRLHVREAGPQDAPPILFIHGWSQGWMSWERQFAPPLTDRFRVVAYDLRGHGSSERPGREEDYTDAQAWAEDVAAIIDQRELVRPVLVGWSFGGYVACDYLRAHGEGGIAGVNFVGWAVMMGNTAKERALAGPGFEDHFADATSEDLPTSAAAMRSFVRACAARDLEPHEFERLLAFNMLVDPFVRRAMALRGTIDNTELLGTLAKPVLVSQGAEDRVTRRAAATHIVGCCPTARESVYEGVGHMPFLEAPERFNRELADFVAAANSTRKETLESPCRS